MDRICDRKSSPIVIEVQMEAIISGLPSDTVPFSISILSRSIFARLDATRIT